jgi:transposase
LSLKRANRRLQVIELMCKGFTEIQIAKKLGVSERTIRRDLRSLEAQEFGEELKRRQLRDIAECEDIRLRLEYRDRLLGKLIPKKVNKKTEGKEEGVSTNS